MIVILSQAIAEAERILANEQVADKLAAFCLAAGTQTQFVSGTTVLRCCGAAGTCTAGGNGVLHSWLRAARKRQDKQKGAQ